MRVVFDSTVLTPTATASSNETGNEPQKAIDGDTSTFWRSTAGDTDPVGPFLQVDLGKILRVYQIIVTFDITEIPTTFRILRSDAPTDSFFGTFSTASSSAFDLVDTKSGSSGDVTVQVIPGLLGRYWRFQKVGTGQTRIKEIQVWATDNISKTTGRLLLGSTMFSDNNNDLLEMNVNEQISKAVKEVNFKINNKRQKYLGSRFPGGTIFRAWIDGVQKIKGRTMETIPTFSMMGFTLNGGGHDDGEDLISNTLHEAWAATPIADSTKDNDIIARGTRSILGLTLNSAGVRTILNTGVENTTGGVNTFNYLRWDGQDAWNLLVQLAEVALSGSWTLQNPGFDQGTVSSATFGAGSSETDGYWTALVTHSNFSAKVRDSSGGGSPDPASLLDVLAAISGGVKVPSRNNSGAYDGSVAKDSALLYAEVFQPVLISISDLNASGSFSASSTIITSSSIGIGAATASQILDVIIETSPSPGVIRRLHLLDTAFQGQLNGSFSFFPPVDTDLDKYDTTTGYNGVNLGSAYLTKFPDGTNDVVLAVRLRSLPYLNGSGANQSIRSVSFDNVTFVTSSKFPPVRYDFYIGLDSNFASVLNWFPRPRPGLELSYRHLGAEHNLRWFINYPESDLNNIQDFNWTTSDTYRTKNDQIVGGAQKGVPADGLNIDTSLANYLSAQSPPHGEKFPEVSVQDSTSMANIGRRKNRVNSQSSDVVELTRIAISSLSVSKNIEQRATITCRGNSNLAPGFCVFVDSDYSDIKGWFYIVTAEHHWTAEGYYTTLTVEDDRFRFSNELAKIQAQIRGPLASGTDKTTTKRV